MYVLACYSQISACHSDEKLHTTRNKLPLILWTFLFIQLFSSLFQFKRFSHTKKDMLSWINTNSPIINYSYKTAGHGKFDIQTVRRHYHIISWLIDTEIIYSISSFWNWGTDEVRQTNLNIEHSITINIRVKSTSTMRHQNHKSCTYYGASLLIDGLVLDCSNPSTLAIELPQPYTKSSRLDWMCLTTVTYEKNEMHDDVIKWKLAPLYWSFVRGIHRSPVNSPHKGQWRVALIFSLICARINGWANNREAGDLRRHPAHYGVIVMGVRTATTANNRTYCTLEQKGVDTFLFPILWLGHIAFCVTNNHTNTV